MTFQLENVRFTNFKIFKNSRIFANFETWNEFYSFIHLFFYFCIMQTFSYFCICEMSCHIKVTVYLNFIT